jgi:hypothetical protein
VWVGVIERGKEGERALIIVRISGCQIMSDILVGQTQYFQQYLSFVKKRKKHFFMQ